YTFLKSLKNALRKCLTT
ncbi:polyribonucleotide nucleotidyltransferase, partial [Vibrio parahaemolyticus VPTS-2010]